MGAFLFGGPPSPYGRSWGWWKRRPRKRLNPNQIHLADTPVNRNVVAAYVADPDRRSSDRNEPCVVYRRDLGYHALEGKHRVLAARHAGRKVRVRVAVDAAAQAPAWWT